eukprot:gene10200-11289_t
MGGAIGTESTAARKYQSNSRHGSFSSSFHRNDSNSMNGSTNLKLLPKEGIKLSHLEVFIQSCGGLDKLKNLTTREVCQRYILPLTDTNKSTYCDYLKTTDQASAIGEAHVYIIHSWKSPFLDLVNTLTEHLNHHQPNTAQDTVLWIDIFSFNQYKPSDLDYRWWLHSLRNSLKQFNQFLIVLSGSGWKAPWTVLHRLWCLYELYLVIDSKALLEVVTLSTHHNEMLKMVEEQGQGYLDSLQHSILIERAEAFKHEDREKILQVIAQTIGFPACNRMIYERLREHILHSCELTIQSQQKANGHSAAMKNESCLALSLSLAKIYDHMHQHEKAEPLLVNCFNQRRASLGENHPEVLQLMNRLACHYRARDFFPQAESLFKDCLERQKAISGEDHVDMAQILYDEALLFKRQGQYEKAESLLLPALQILRHHIESHSSLFLHVMNTLAGVYRTEGKYESALPILKDLVARMQITCPEHIDGLQALTHLGEVYQALHQYDEAEKVYEECLERSLRLLGEHHPDRLTVMTKLATLYEAVGRLEEAERLLSECVEMRKLILGETHFSTQSVKLTLKHVKDRKKQAMREKMALMANGNSDSSGQGNNGHLTSSSPTETASATPLLEAIALASSSSQPQEHAQAHATHLVSPPCEQLSH